VAPAIHIGPEAQPEIVAAVEAGGGRVVPLAEAAGLVWIAPESQLGELPAGIRWVQLQSAGVEPWMERVAANPQITFTSATGVYATEVAELALTLLLAGVRGLWRYGAATSWDPHDDRVLEGSTVAIVGAGGIGRALIERLAPHDVQVLAVTRRGLDVPGAARTLPADRMSDIWGVADHFVIAAPATSATRHLVGAEQLAAMPAHAWVINVARGSLIDTDALVAALEAGSIGGAGLDVTNPEPLPDGHPLWSQPRALITPHVANPPSAQFRHLARRVQENVRRFAAGEELEALVDTGRGY
jgi:phosphoglycerate dehydrogenase-like enzyme